MSFNEGVLWYIAFLFSTVFHEASHAFVAMKLGDNTAYEGGQVTLNPLPHIKQEPFGMVFVPFICFLTGSGWILGWASAPYNIFWARAFPKSSAKMSFAGPAANFFLVLVSGFLIHLGFFFKIFTIADNGSLSHLVQATQGSFFVPFATFLSILFSLNIILGIFNLIPFPPLDGSGILPYFLSHENAIKYMDTFQHNPFFMLVGILVAWNLFPFLINPAFKIFLTLLYMGAV